MVFIVHIKIRERALLSHKIIATEPKIDNQISEFPHRLHEHSVIRIARVRSGGVSLSRRKS